MEFVSLEGTYSERTVLRSPGICAGFTWYRDRCRILRSVHGRSGLIRGNTVEKGRRWYEEQISRDRGAEVEDSIVVSRRPPDEHVFKHFFDRARRAAVPDEIGAELAAARASEGHIIAQDFYFFAV